MSLAVDYWGTDTAGIIVALALGVLAFALVLPLKAALPSEQRAAGRA